VPLRGAAGPAEEQDVRTLLITCRGALGVADHLYSELEAAGASVSYVGRGTAERDRLGRVSRHLMATGTGRALDEGFAAFGRHADFELSVSSTRGASFVTLVAEPATVELATAA